MTAPLRRDPFPDAAMIVRVPMSRKLYARVLAEAVMLNRSPDVLIRDMLIAAFESGDLSDLSVDVQDGGRVIISSVASASKPKQQED